MRASTILKQSGYGAILSLSLISGLSPVQAQPSRSMSTETSIYCRPVKCSPWYCPPPPRGCDY